MRNRFLVLLLLGITFNLNSQVIKLNQERPQPQESHKKIKLEKDLTISDHQGGFFFRDPQSIQVSENSNYFIKDFHNLYLFDNKGKFIKNISQRGQGPGEITKLRSYKTYRDSLIVFNVMPKKIIRFDLQGTFKNESRIFPQIYLAEFVMYRKDKYYFIYSSMPPANNKRDFIDIDYTLTEISNNGKSSKDLISFPVKKYVISEGQAWKAYNIGKLEVQSHNDKILVLAHTPQYLIKIYNIENQELSHIFSRTYKRVKYSNPLWKDDPDAPKLKYNKDILKIQCTDFRIWVITSTLHKTKGRLVDTFDYQGNFLQSYYIKTPGEILSITKDHFFTKETGKNQNITISRHKLTLT